MEGICGIISFDRNGQDLNESIQGMIAGLSDGEALGVAQGAGQGWALAACGWQEQHWHPMHFFHQDDGLVLAGIADVHNISELAKSYRLPDTALGQIFAESFRSSGKEWLTQFRGSFSILLFDLKARRLLAATDRIGIRPVYWHQDAGTFYISSRIACIRRVRRNLEVNLDSVYAYIRHDMVPSPWTIYKRVEKLEPGCMLEAGQHKFITRYWDIISNPKITDSQPDIAKEVYRRLESAVQIMSNGAGSTKELGCFLSGGTDSSSICGLLSRMNSSAVAAFSVGFPENGYDEMFYARVAAKSFDLDHHEFYIQPKDVLPLLPDIISVYDEPFGNSSALPSYFCAKSAAHSGKSYLLAGDGGDEIFAGNDRYGTQALFRRYFKIPRLLRQGLLEPILLNRLEKLPLELLRKGGSYIRRAKMPEVERIHSYRYVTDSEMFSDTFLRAVDNNATEGIAARHFDMLADADALDRHLYMDMKLTITDNDLRKVTRMCDLAHVRVRYPMLDHQIIDFCFLIPTQLKLKNTSGLRYIFKEAFGELLPEEILKKTKHGFGLPISNWLRDNDEIKQFAYDLLFDTRHLQRGYFKESFVSSLWKLQLEDKTPYYGGIVWNMLMLEAWHKVHLDEGTL